MSDWINSGGHAPRQSSDAYLKKELVACDPARWKLPLRISCALLLAALVSASGYARDLDGRYAAQNPELHRWFESLRSGKGPCCSDADGKALSDTDWEVKGGHYRVLIESQWWDVPNEAVIKGPNRAGRTMVWPVYYRVLDDQLRIDIRCFMPGVMM